MLHSIDRGSHPHPGRLLGGAFDVRMSVKYLSIFPRRDAMEHRAAFFRAI
jgi:hypothetical protein